MYGKYLVVSIHDASPKNLVAIEDILWELEKRNVSPLSVLVIPNHEGRYPVDSHPEFVQYMKTLEEKGCEIVLHGYEHISGKGKYGSLRSRIQGLWGLHLAEFECLDYDSSRMKLEKGIAMFDRLGIEVSGFVPPCWSVNQESYRAIRDMGFSYMTLRDKIIRLKDGGIIESRAYEFEGILTFLDYWNRFHNSRISGRSKQTEVIRIPLHPRDLLGSKPLYRALDIIDRYIEQGRELVTYADYINSVKN